MNNEREYQSGAIEAEELVVTHCRDSGRTCGGQQVDWVPNAFVADQAVEDRQHGHGCAADQSTTNTSRVRVNFQRQPRAMIQFADLKMPHLATWDRENQFFLLQAH